MHKTEAFFYLTASFLLGVFAASVLNLDYRWVLGFVILGTIIAAVSGYEKTFARSKRAERNRVFGLVLGAACLLFAAGVARYDYFSLGHSTLQTFAEHQAKGKGIPVVLNGYVDAEETISSSGNGQVIFKATSLVSAGREIKTDERTILTVSPSSRYTLGQPLTVAGALYLPQNFNGFDYAQYLKNKDIRTVMFRPTVTGNPGLQLNWYDRVKIGLYGRLFAVKDSFQRAIIRSVPDPYGQYLTGVLLGSRSDIPQNLKDAFNKTSTTHILAISGYNITIIAEALLAVLVYFMKRRKAFWISIVAIILFTILTGATASVVRAAVMGLILLAASGYGRMYSPRNAIMIAAAAMVLLNPSILVFDVGFQLSFLAVIGLLAVYPVLENKTKRWPEIWGIKETLLMTASAQLAVAPLLVYYFHQFSLVSLAANILVLPLMPHTMLFGFLTGIGGLIWFPLGRLIGLLAGALSAYQLSVISWLAALPFASLNIGIHWVTLAVVYALLVVWIWWLRPREVVKAKQV